MQRRRLTDSQACTITAMPMNRSVAAEFMLMAMENASSSAMAFATISVCAATEGSGTQKRQQAVRTKWFGIRRDFSWLLSGKRRRYPDLLVAFRGNGFQSRDCGLQENKVATRTSVGTGS